ncbi:MAG: glycosyltransferase [Acidobacteria bacterium]|nr:MAG: glycosyltransferase [Acidobacteriota bacterium]
MAKPLVSVVIPNYNYANFLEEAIASVLAQTYPNIEIIVVDDGSSDNSREVLKKYTSQVKVIFQSNQGVSVARNTGVAESKGDLIAFLDADDIWLSTKVEKQVDLFTRDSSLGLVHVGVEEIDPNGRGLKIRMDGAFGWVLEELLLLRSSVLGGGSGAMVWREVFDNLGGFDPRLSTSADWDFYCRLARFYPIGFVPEILLKYRIHRTSMHHNIDLMEHDMLIAFEKAFSEQVNVSAKKCYGSLYRMLAGSYFYAGKYSKCLRYTLRSLITSPAEIGYFLSYSLRQIKRGSK